MIVKFAFTLVYLGYWLGWGRGREGREGREGEGLAGGNIFLFLVINFLVYNIMTFLSFQLRE